MKVSYFANARTALKNSFKELDFQTNDIILIPDFICDAVLIPINQFKLKVLYYSIDKNLSPNWDDILNYINKNKVKALLMINYFGQPNEILKYLDISFKNNIILIEDNAHGHGGKYKGKILGHYGNIGISSPRKILNLPTGGILYSKIYNRKKIILKPFPIYKPKFIVKIILSYFIKFYNKLRYYRFSNLNWNNPYLFQSITSKDYKIDFISKFIIRKTNWNNIAKLRREYWILWSEFAINKGLSPIYKELSSESCPWALPLIAKDIEERNKWINWGLKNNINIFMWPSLPKEIINKEGNAMSIWRCLVCISLDRPPKFDKDEDKNL